MFCILGIYHVSARSWYFFWRLLKLNKKGLFWLMFWLQRFLIMISQINIIWRIASTHLVS